jgi:hypothetical protein
MVDLRGSGTSAEGDRLAPRIISRAGNVRVIIRLPDYASAGMTNASFIARSLSPSPTSTRALIQNRRNRRQFSFKTSCEEK